MKSIKVNSQKVYINMYNVSVFLIINYCLELDSVILAGENINMGKYSNCFVVTDRDAF